MRDWYIFYSHHLNVFGLLYLCLALVISQDSDPKCTKTRTGLPANNFNRGFGGWKDLKTSTAWMSTYKSNSEKSPVKPYEGEYIYLDSEKSGEKPRKIEAQISSAESICVDFYYATSGPSLDPIRFYLWDDTQYALMHEFIPETEAGSWSKTTFSCCLPNPKSTTRKVSLEATSHKDAIVVIDYIDIRLGEMACGDNSKLVCNPPPPTEVPPQETTISIKEKTTTALNVISTGKSDPDPKCTLNRNGLPAYNFNSGLSTWSETDNSGAWKYTEDSSLIKPYEKGYVYLDDKESKEQPKAIEGRISATGDVQALCAEFFFATTGPSDQPIHFFLLNGTQKLLMHEVLPTQEIGVWSSTTFSCCLPNNLSGKRKLSLEATSQKDAIVAIDYIDVRHSNMACEDRSKLVCYPPPPTVEPPQQTTQPPPTAKVDIPEPNPECTSDRRGLPAYDFEGGLTTWLEPDGPGDEIAWIHAENGGPVVPFNKKYVYLDDKKSSEQPKRLQGKLAAAEAICVEFFYATSGPSNESIRFYLWDETQDLLMHEVIPTQEPGTWNYATFSCCLPKADANDRRLVLEATSTANSLVAIDFIDVRHANIKCGDDSKLKCFPSPPTEEPPEQTPVTTLSTRETSQVPSAVTTLTVPMTSEAKEQTTTEESTEQRIDDKPTEQVTTDEPEQITIGKHIEHITTDEPTKPITIVKPIEQTTTAGPEENTATVSRTSKETNTEILDSTAQPDTSEKLTDHTISPRPNGTTATDLLVTFEISQTTTTENTIQQTITEEQVEQTTTETQIEQITTEKQAEETTKEIEQMVTDGQIQQFRAEEQIEQTTMEAIGQIALDKTIEQTAKAEPIDETTVTPLTLEESTTETVDVRPQSTPNGLTEQIADLTTNETTISGPSYLAVKYSHPPTTDSLFTKMPFIKDNKRTSSAEYITTTENTPTKDNATEETPTRHRPAEDEPTKGTPTNGTQPKETPSKDMSTKTRPTEDMTTKNTPAEAVPIESWKTIIVPLKDAPTEDAPTKDTPNEITPTEDEPVEDTPIEDAPTEDTLVEYTPIEDTPMPYKGTPTERTTTYINAKSTESSENKPLSAMPDSNIGSEAVEASINWTIIVNGIVGAVLLVGILIVVLLVRSKRRRGGGKITTML